MIRFGPIRLYEDGSYTLPISNPETGFTDVLGGCGIPSQDCVDSHYNPDGFDDVPLPDDVRDTALDYQNA